MPGVYTLQIDWNNDGDFADANEDVTSDTLEISWERGRDVVSQLTGRFVSGRLEAVLKDQTGKYASFNSASPLYGSILPGRKVQLLGKSGSFPYTFPIQFDRPIWSGFLDRIEPLPTVEGFQMAKLSAFGPLGYLNERQVSVAMQTNRRTDLAIGDVLDEAGWPAADRSLDTGQTTMGRWWADRKSVLNSLREIELTESGFLLETKDRKFAFENRHHRLAAPHTISQATFSDAAAAALSLTGWTAP